MSFSDSLLLLRIYDFVTSTLTLDKSQTLSLHVFHQEHGNYIYLPVWIVVKVECSSKCSKTQQSVRQTRGTDTCCIRLNIWCICQDLLCQQSLILSTSSSSPSYKYYLDLWFLYEYHFSSFLWLLMRLWRGGIQRCQSLEGPRPGHLERHGQC